jgi:hypothetical protein
MYRDEAEKHIRAGLTLTQLLLAQSGQEADIDM